MELAAQRGVSLAPPCAAPGMKGADSVPSNAAKNKEKNKEKTIKKDIAAKKTIKKDIAAKGCSPGAEGGGTWQMKTQLMCEAVLQRRYDDARRLALLFNAGPLR